MKSSRHEKKAFLKEFPSVRASALWLLDLHRGNWAASQARFWRLYRLAKQKGGIHEANFMDRTYQTAHRVNARIGL